MLSVYDGVKLKGWSFNSGKPLEGPLWNGRPTYFVYYACANDIIPWDFWIDLEVNIIRFEYRIMEYLIIVFISLNLYIILRKQK